jgi:crossover junction endodeoxyribonuclease RuvC
MTIGIDPGTATVGFSLVKGTKRTPIIQEYGVLTTKAGPKEIMPFRLLEIAQDIEELLKKYKPDTAVVEELFFFKNAKTVISVAQSRGVILHLLAKHNIDIIEVTPLQVKQTLCGYGRATKQQVQNMVKRIYSLEEIPKPDDAADSLAMAWIGLANT